MFTGLVSEIGVIRSIDRVSAHLRLVMHAPVTAAETAVGESINISGACQTVTGVGGDEFSVDTIPETMKKTTLGDLRPGSRVNLEPSLKPTDRLGGHIVSGHVDCVGTVYDTTRHASAIEITVAFPDQYGNLIVSQGSVAIDGISLTVAEVIDNRFRVAVIPTTWEATTLSDLRAGSKVNLEFDMIGKYVVRFLASSKSENEIDETMLRNLGY